MSTQRKRSRFTVISFPVFSNYLVHVEVAKDMKKALLRYKETENIPVDNSEAITAHIKNASRSFIFLPPDASVNVITHESFHVVQRMLDYMGCEFDKENYAYHVGYLSGKVFDFVHASKGRR